MDPNDTPLANGDAKDVDRRDVLAWIAVGASLGGYSTTATAQEEGDDGGEEGAAGGGSVTVELVDYAYEPGTDSALEIPPGTLVQFVWVTDNHNIAVDEQPGDAAWEGHEPIENTPFEYEFTFDVEGTYEFHCDPHLGLGMVGTIVVDSEATVSEDGDGLPEIVPEPAMTVLIGTVLALLAVLGLTYAFLRFGGPSGE